MKKALSIYVHIPFCMKKCAYCDFLSMAGTTVGERMQYVTALCREIQMYRPFADRYTVRTVFIGGGTPTVLDESMIEVIMNTLRATFSFERFPEITIEANPGTMKYADLVAFHEMGINRISIGLQSADIVCLERLGRIHNYEQFREGYDMACRAGFRNINVDVMSGIPGQDIHSFVDTLTRVTEMNPQHISVYSLQVEEGTPLSEDEELLNMLPGEAQDRAMYAMTKRVLGSAGYNRYEISNYAKEGYDCRHNMVYWTGGEYIGFGIGAASLFKGERFTNIRDIRTYVELMEDAQEALAVSDDRLRLYEEVSKRLRLESSTQYIETRMEEFMFLGLRLTRGVRCSEFRQRFNRDIYEVYGSVIHKYEKDGFLETGSDFVRLTDRGIDVSNYILADFLLG